MSVPTGQILETTAVNEIIINAESLTAKADVSDKEFASGYDRLLWSIVTSSAKELEAAGERIYEPPLLDIPRPLQVSILRLAALSAGNGASRRRLLDLLASLCDPAQEEVIVSPLRDETGTA